VAAVEGDADASRLLVCAAGGRGADAARADEICVEVDAGGGRIVVDPPEGLLDVNRAGPREVRHRHDLPADGRSGPLAEGIVRPRDRARAAGREAVHDLRDFTTDRHRVVDDVPFGGGPGMVLKPEPLFGRSRRSSGASGGRRTR
jgi:hypothetical protein